MFNKISKASLFSVLGGFLALILITGCPGHRYMAGGQAGKRYFIEGAAYDGAFTKAMKTLEEIGFQVNQFYRSTGTIRARRGAGFTEVTEIDILIENDVPEKLSLQISIKSSKDHDKFIAEFLKAYGKYVKIVPHSDRPSTSLNPQPDEPPAPTL